MSPELQTLHCMLPWDGLAAEISGSAPKRAKPILVRLARVTGIALGGFYWVLLEGFSHPPPIFYRIFWA